jgi:hypothetical protein
MTKENERVIEFSGSWKAAAGTGLYLTRVIDSRKTSDEIER